MKKDSKDKMLIERFLLVCLCKGATQSILVPAHSSMHRPPLRAGSQFPVWPVHKAKARRKKLEERVGSSCQHSSASANGNTILVPFWSKENNGSLWF